MKHLRPGTKVRVIRQAGDMSGPYKGKIGELGEAFSTYNFPYAVWFSAEDYEMFLADELEPIPSGHAKLSEAKHARRSLTWNDGLTYTQRARELSRAEDDMMRYG